MANYDFLSVSDGTGDSSLMHITAARAVGATTITVDTISRVAAKFIGTSGTLLPSGLLDPATVTNFRGHIAASALQIDAFEPGSTDVGNTVGQVVIVKPNTGWANRVATFIQNASGNGTPESLTANALTTTGAITAASQSLAGSALTNASVSPLALKAPIAMRGYLGADFVTASNVWSTCPLIGEYALGGFVNDGANGYTVPVSGIYQVNITVTHQDNPSGSAGTIIAGLGTNSNSAGAPSQPAWYQRTGFTNNPSSICMSRTYQLGAGTHVYLQTYAGGNGQNYRCRGGDANDGTVLELFYLGPLS